MKPVDALVTAGKKVGEIPVTLSYHIIEHFSKGLYSSPNKALEELVSNSYDALAGMVHVILPDNVESEDAVIWVIDDGQSMDATGLEVLWHIGESNKRDPRKASSERPPIGKFGIGKLATYVLAKKLTFVTKARGKYRAVTMDYSRVEREADGSLKLDLRELTRLSSSGKMQPLARCRCSDRTRLGRGPSPR